MSLRAVSPVSWVHGSSEEIIMVTSSVTILGNFLKYLAKNILTKVAKILVDFWRFLQTSFLNEKNCCDYFWDSFLKIWGQFWFQHLVRSQGHGLKETLNCKFHWLRQIATTLRKFHWRFWIFLDTIAKAKKLIHESIAQNLKWVSLTKRFFSFGNGI